MQRRSSKRAPKGQVVLVDPSMERRRYRRYARPGFITIFPCVQGQAGKPLRVRFRDLCIRGIGIIHTSPMDVGDCFLLGLIQEDQKLCVVLFAVVNCADTDDGQHNIGAEPVWVLRNQRIVDGQQLSDATMQRINQMIELHAMREG